jgi:hypothetical protein
VVDLDAIFILLISQKLWGSIGLPATDLAEKELEPKISSTPDWRFGPWVDSDRNSAGSAKSKTMP